MFILDMLTLKIDNQKQQQQQQEHHQLKQRQLKEEKQQSEQQIVVRDSSENLKTEQIVPETRSRQKNILATATAPAPATTITTKFIKTEIEAKTEKGIERPIIKQNNTYKMTTKSTTTKEDKHDTIPTTATNKTTATNNVNEDTETVRETAIIEASAIAKPTLVGISNTNTSTKSNNNNKNNIKGILCFSNENGNNNNNNNNNSSFNDNNYINNKSNNKNHNKSNSNKSSNVFVCDTRTQSDKCKWLKTINTNEACDDNDDGEDGDDDDNNKRVHQQSRVEKQKSHSLNYDDNVVCVVVSDATATTTTTTKTEPCPDIHKAWLTHMPLSTTAIATINNNHNTYDKQVCNTTITQASSSLSSAQPSQQTTTTRKIMRENSRFGTKLMPLNSLAELEAQIEKLMASSNEKLKLNPHPQPSEENVKADFVSATTETLTTHAPAECASLMMMTMTEKMVAMAPSLVGRQEATLKKKCIGAREYEHSLKVEQKPESHVDYATTSLEQKQSEALHETLEENCANELLLISTTLYKTTPLSSPNPTISPPPPPLPAPLCTLKLHTLATAQRETKEIADTSVVKLPLNAHDYVKNDIVDGDDDDDDNIVLNAENVRSKNGSSASALYNINNNNNNNHSNGKGQEQLETLKRTTENVTPLSASLIFSEAVAVAAAAAAEADAAAPTNDDENSQRAFPKCLLNAAADEKARSVDETVPGASAKSSNRANNTEVRDNVTVGPSSIAAAAAAEAEAAVAEGAGTASAARQPASETGLEKKSVSAAKEKQHFCCLESEFQFTNFLTKQHQQQRQKQIGGEDKKAKVIKTIANGVIQCFNCKENECQKSADTNENTFTVTTATVTKATKEETAKEAINKLNERICEKFFINQQKPQIQNEQQQHEHEQEEQKEFKENLKLNQKQTEVAEEKKQRQQQKQQQKQNQKQLKQVHDIKERREVVAENAEEGDKEGGAKAEEEKRKADIQKLTVPAAVAAARAEVKIQSEQKFACVVNEKQEKEEQEQKEVKGDDDTNEEKNSNSNFFFAKNRWCYLYNKNNSTSNQIRKLQTSVNNNYCVHGCDNGNNNGDYEDEDDGDLINLSIINCEKLCANFVNEVRTFPSSSSSKNNTHPNPKLHGSTKTKPKTTASTSTSPPTTTTTTTLPSSTIFWVPTTPPLSLPDQNRNFSNDITKEEEESSEQIRKSVKDELEDEQDKEKEKQNDYKKQKDIDSDKKECKKKDFHESEVGPIKTKEKKQDITLENKNNSTRQQQQRIAQINKYNILQQQHHKLHQHQQQQQFNLSNNLIQNNEILNDSSVDVELYLNQIEVSSRYDKEFKTATEENDRAEQVVPEISSLSSSSSSKLAAPINTLTKSCEESTAVVPQQELFIINNNTNIINSSLEQVAQQQQQQKHNNLFKQSTNLTTTIGLDTKTFETENQLCEIDLPFCNTFYYLSNKNFQQQQQQQQQSNSCHYEQQQQQQQQQNKSINPKSTTTSRTFDGYEFEGASQRLKRLQSNFQGRCNVVKIEQQENEKVALTEEDHEEQEKEETIIHPIKATTTTTTTTPLITRTKEFEEFNLIEVVVVKDNGNDHHNKIIKVEGAKEGVVELDLLRSTVSSSLSEQEQPQQEQQQHQQQEEQQQEQQQQKAQDSSAIQLTENSKKVEEETKDNNNTKIQKIIDTQEKQDIAAATKVTITVKVKENETAGLEKEKCIRNFLLHTNCRQQQQQQRRRRRQQTAEIQNERQTQTLTKALNKNIETTRKQIERDIVIPTPIPIPAHVSENFVRLSKLNKAQNNTKRARDIIRNFNIEKEQQQQQLPNKKLTNCDNKVVLLHNYDDSDDYFEKDNNVDDNDDNDDDNTEGIEYVIVTDDDDDDGNNKIVAGLQNLSNNKIIQGDSLSSLSLDKISSSRINENKIDIIPKHKPPITVTTLDNNKNLTLNNTEYSIANEIVNFQNNNNINIRSFGDNNQLISAFGTPQPFERRNNNTNNNCNNLQNTTKRNYTYNLPILSTFTEFDVRNLEDYINAEAFQFTSQSPSTSTPIITSPIKFRNKNIRTSLTQQQQQQQQQQLKQEQHFDRNHNNNNNIIYDNIYQKYSYTRPIKSIDRIISQTASQTPFHCYDELLTEYIDSASDIDNQDHQDQEYNNNDYHHQQIISETDLNDVEILSDNTLSSSTSTLSPVCHCENCLKTNIDNDVDDEYDEEDIYNQFPFIINSNNNNNKMREVNGQLRGLLKKPNRPPPARKNRVVFDETRNEFFEADYIILIREDCAYDEEDEEPCTCGEHELVRLCCEEGCQCNYAVSGADATADGRTPQSPKFQPPIEFVDDAALSPPDGYKDNSLKSTLGGALSGHIFGAQHIQQLQVIQRLQQQRAAMLAARNNSQIPPPPPPVGSAALSQHQQQQKQQQQQQAQPGQQQQQQLQQGQQAVVVTQPPSSSQQPHSPDEDLQGVCTECAECAECAAKQMQDAECTSPQCQDELNVASLGVVNVPPTAVALLPLHTSSPERRITQKEIIAGEERPKYVLQSQYKPSAVKDKRDKIMPNQMQKNKRFVVETITTMTTVTERRIIREATEDCAGVAGSGTNDMLPPALPAKASSSVGLVGGGGATGSITDGYDEQKAPPLPPKESSPTQISGILKGGKLWKQDSISQSDDQNNTTSEDESGTIKRSVRFVTEDGASGADGENQSLAGDLDDGENQINELIPIKKHSTLFNNALRPNSAVRQLFPSVSHQAPVLTSEALRAFDESKRAGCLVTNLPGSCGDSDTLRRSMERNILRRSLIKKKAVKSDISLEERIKQLTCDIDEDNEDSARDPNDDDQTLAAGVLAKDGNDGASVNLTHRDSPAGEENPQKFLSGNGEKSFSPSSSVSSSSSGSSAYKKIADIFNREKKQEKIYELEENPIVIIPQECRCPAAPDLGMGIQVPVVHTQIHRTPPRQTEPKRQFLSTLAPLTACVAGNKDDLSSYYTLAAAHHGGHGHHGHALATNAHFAEFNLGMMADGQVAAAAAVAAQCAAGNASGGGMAIGGTGDEVRKVAPDVIAGTPGQEQQDELVAFAQQEANRTEKIKKRYTNDTSNASSDDDEQNDYGFNKRPSVRGIKPKFSSTNEILQQMQEQLTQQIPTVVNSQPVPQVVKSYAIPNQPKSQMSQNPSPQNMPHGVQQQHQQQQAQAQQQQHQKLQQQQQQQQMSGQQTLQLQGNTIAQQKTEQRTWSFYATDGSGASVEQQQRFPVESAAAQIQQTYYQTLPAGAMFRQTMIQHAGQDAAESLMYAQNCQSQITSIEQKQHYAHYARSPTRRPESPPPLRNYHQTMVLIPYNAETYSQFATTNMDPKVAHIQRQNILEYQQVTQQTIRVPIGYALPGMQLHVVAGRGHGAAGTSTHYGQHPHAQRIMQQQQQQQQQHYQYAPDGAGGAGMPPGFSERGVPEGAAAVSHTDCAGSMISPTSAGQQQQLQQQQQQQLQQQQQQQLQQQQVQHQQQPQQQQIPSTQQQQQQQLQHQQHQQQQHQQQHQHQHQQQQQHQHLQQQQQQQNNVVSGATAAAQGSIYYAMNV